MMLEESAVSNSSRGLSLKIWILFICAWLLAKLPFLFLSDIPLNADIAVHLSMAQAWIQGEAPKFMWGQNYLGSLETLWIALWMRIFPLSAPSYFLPNLALALIADLLFLKCAIPLLKNGARALLMVFLVISPFAVLEPQLHPCYSYTLISIFIFWACLIKTGFIQGILLGLAFYTQPIAIYFIAPFFLFYLLAQQWKKALFFLLGFSILVLFIAYPIAGPSMNVGVLVNSIGQRDVTGVSHWFSNYFWLLLGFLPQNSLWIKLGLALFALQALVFLVILGLRRKTLWAMALPSRRFFWLMAFTFLFIPLSFILRKYDLVDDGIKRYLWLWHYPFYFVICWLLSRVGKGFKLVAGASIIFFIALLSWRAFQTYQSGRSIENADLLFKKVIAEMRQRDLRGVVGDYWAVYPIAYFSTEDGPLIPGAALKGNMRNKEWRNKISALTQVAYVCWKDENWCEKNPPGQIRVGVKRYDRISSSPPLTIQQGPESLVFQVYEESLDF